ncbi:MAG: hypothetical protein IKG67_04875 [Parasporobacterium sp.]|nr:hypothetical protein [Parasporobacterium sp.]
MATDKKYRLKIRRDGVVRYLMSDGSFWEPRNCPQLTIHEFTSRMAAIQAWSDWANRYPASASYWIPEWEEI